MDQREDLVSVMLGARRRSCRCRLGPKGRSSRCVVTGRAMKVWCWEAAASSLRRKERVTRGTVGVSLFER